MKKRMLGLALSLCLTLTACGGEPKESGGQTSILGQAAGLEETELLLTIQGREVPAWRYLYWLAYTCDQIAARYEASRLTLDWNIPVSGGTLADYAKDQALADTALYATVENWAAEQNCAPPEESASGALPALGLPPERLAELEAVGGQYAALYALYETEGSPLAPTAEELTAYGESAGAMTLDRVLVPAGEDREAARNRAAELFSQLNSAEDQAAVFARLAAAGGDTAGPRTALPGDGTWEETLWEAAAALEEGQCSGILESEEGFSILRRLPLEPDALRQACFDHRLETAAAGAAVTVEAAYDALDAARFYDALRGLRQGGGDV